MELIPELIEAIVPDFKKHIEIEGNHGVVFSGKFGKGKTTFLKTVFANQDPSMAPLEFRRAIPVRGVPS